MKITKISPSIFEIKFTKKAMDNFKNIREWEFQHNMPVQLIEHHIEKSLFNYLCDFDYIYEDLKDV